MSATTLPSAEQCEEIFHAALSAGDGRGVEAALRLLAVQDPHRAQALLDLTRFALDFAREQSGAAGPPTTERSSA